MTEINKHFNNHTISVTLDGRYRGDSTSEVQNEITNIDFLAGMTNLTELQLDCNEISDISPLQNLTNLTDLTLYSNQISDISALNNLTNLTSLVLETNHISDISPLNNPTNLTFLSVSIYQNSDEETEKLRQALPNTTIIT